MLYVSDSAFPQIHPNRLQFFEYDTISVKCDGPDGSADWRVMKKLKKDPVSSTQWETSTGSLIIKVVFTSDSGEYWCENQNGTMNKSINISVTGIYQLLTNLSVDGS